MTRRLLATRHLYPSRRILLALDQHRIHLAPPCIRPSPPAQTNTSHYGFPSECRLATKSGVHGAITDTQAPTTRRAAATRRNDENAVAQPIRSKASLNNLGQAQRVAAAPSTKKPATTATAKVGTKRAALAGVNGNVKEEVEEKKAGGLLTLLLRSPSTNAHLRQSQGGSPTGLGPTHQQCSRGYYSTHCPRPRPCC